MRGRSRTDLRAEAVRGQAYGVDLPTGGLSIPGSPGGNFPDPETDVAFTHTPVEEAGDGLRLLLVESPVNDDRLARAVVGAFREVVAADPARGGGLRTHAPDTGDRERMGNSTGQQWRD